MKQSITKEQWDELSDKERKPFVDCRFKKNCITPVNELPTIGQLIEFLGDDLVDISFNCYRGDMLPINKEISVEYWTDEMKSPKYFNKPEPINALWEAVKYKLRG